MKSEGNFGRSSDRDGRYPNGMWKYNRADLSYQEMFLRPRSEGDFFAVFRSETGEVRVEYARYEDYSDFAFRQVQKAITRNHRGIVPEDVYLLIGCTMISRIHNYNFDNFVQLLDHNLSQVFDMRKLVEWTNLNQSFFGSPVEDAILADAEDSAGLQEEYARMPAGAQ